MYRQHTHLFLACTLIANTAAAGIAGGMALAAIPQTMSPGAGYLGAGIGAYGDAAALAIDYSHASQDGRTVFKLGVSAGMPSRIGAQAGVSFRLY